MKHWMPCPDAQEGKTLLYKPERDGHLICRATELMKCLPLYNYEAVGGEMRLLETIAFAFTLTLALKFLPAHIYFYLVCSSESRLHFFLFGYSIATLS